MTTSEFLADLVLLAHAIFSMFVLFGWIVLLAGLAFRWEWTNRKWLRVLHLAATLLVATRVWIGLPCPFSVAEDSLRRQTNVPCPLQNPIHDTLKRLAFRGADPRRFASSTTLFASWVLAVHFGIYGINCARNRACPTDRPFSKKGMMRSEMSDEVVLSPD